MDLPIPRYDPVATGFMNGSTGPASGVLCGCRRIIWLNPLIGWRDYAPRARGMQAALPYVDLFAPAHNLASLAALEPYLARI